MGSVRLGWSLGLAVAVALAASAGCVRTELATCDGLTCPSGRICRTVDSLGPG